MNVKSASYKPIWQIIYSGILLKSLSHFKYALRLNQGLLIQNLIAKYNIQKNKEKRLSNIMQQNIFSRVCSLLLSGTYVTFLEKKINCFLIYVIS